MRRVLLGLSQDELAKRLTVTAQQIQKYEAGETRTSSSRLHEISRHLGIPVTWFFQELENVGSTLPASAEPSNKPDFMELIVRPEARNLLEVYFNIADEKLRKKVLQMASLLADEK